MAKNQKQFLCDECGALQPKWLGKCPDCGAWNSLREFAVPSVVRADMPAVSDISSSQARPLCEVAADRVLPRLSCGMQEMDRVLGGGYVPGGVVLLGGEPGIGKTRERSGQRSDSREARRIRPARPQSRNPHKLLVASRGCRSGPIPSDLQIFQLPRGGSGEQIATSFRGARGSI